ncbi:hypothetical protein CBR_g7974 [Chara braunii]|uniref:Right handed beta helix domain-containing protein n=1 Tax=Chara braunii TaxID=69332 RepID=A0A388KL37_CHABU|nr:hypothetical protein CBR_g7974 [Chara braunii]|eukprot:GBG70673.1 hypothetical protein CBR_g7974 [Chara braunii]
MAAFSCGGGGGGGRRGLFSTSTFLVAMVVVLLLQHHAMSVDAYGLADFLAAYNNPNVSYHEVKADIALKASLPAIDRALTLVGKGPKPSRPVVIDGSSKFAGIVTEADIKLVNLEFRNFRSASGGALSASGANAVVDQCIFRNNRATSGNGGALDFSDTGLTIRRSQFVRNRASRQGGAIYTFTDDFGRIEDCVFDGNSAADGGALAFRQQIGIRVRKSTFRSNRARQQGGAIYFSRGLSTVSDNKFIKNVAGSFGGAFRFFGDDQGVLTICRGNSYSGNKAKPATSNNVYLLVVSGDPNFPNVFYCGALPPATLVNATNGGIATSCRDC